jgi:NADP-dependent 3-hydroxy acid dehydrogenase YdfG
MYKSILITGAGSGLGEGSAIGLAKKGVLRNRSSTILAAGTWVSSAARP